VTAATFHLDHFQLYQLYLSLNLPVQVSLPDKDQNQAG
jgi:hypothetical protein